MPNCPSPCSGSCAGHCVCVILGDKYECQDVGNYDELLKKLNNADEIRIWDDHALVEEMRRKISAGAPLILEAVPGEARILLLRKGEAPSAS